MTCYVGIDPGANGGIAVIQGIEIAQVIAMPWKDHYPNFNVITRWIKDNVQIDVVYASIENTFRPNILVVTSGVLVGTFLHLEIPFDRVSAQTWRKEVLGNGKASKKDAIEWCLRHYPTVNLKKTPKSRKNHDGMAESLAIAEYCRRKHSVLGE